MLTNTVFLFLPRLPDHLQICKGFKLRRARGSQLILHHQPRRILMSSHFLLGSHDSTTWQCSHGCWRPEGIITSVVAFCIHLEYRGRAAVGRGFSFHHPSCWRFTIFSRLLCGNLTHPWFCLLVPVQRNLASAPLGLESSALLNSYIPMYECSIPLTKSS